MERHFDLEMKDLEQRLLAMAVKVEESIKRVNEALQNRDVESAQRVMMDDEKIDEMELEIDNFALSLLSRYQPTAIDLRFIINAIKINSELERIADLSVDIAQRVVQIAPLPLLKPLVDIPRLASIAEGMVRDVLAAFINRDVELAKKVILTDDQADDLRNLVQKELLEDYILKDPSTAPRALPLLLVSRHLERICDHTTNIAEDIIYMVTAEVVKHHPERL